MIMPAIDAPHDIGVLTRLRILCISETGWHDTLEVFDDIKAAGGFAVDQYELPKQKSSLCLYAL
jgi:hypothetical protein